VRAKARTKVFPELITHRAQPLTDVPGGRCRRALRRVHQEPERHVKDDADEEARREKGKDDEDDAYQQRIDTEVGGEAGTDAPDDAIRPTP
jgi:hypothetical protein